MSHALRHNGFHYSLKRQKKRIVIPSINIVCHVYRKPPTKLQKAQINWVNIITLNYT